MLIGILSDSHGEVERTASAVTMLRDRGAQALIHLGDVETDDVINELVADLPAYLVFGNCDPDWQPMSRYARSLGINVKHPAGLLEADGKTIAFTHGHLESHMRDALERQVDYLLHGHSHMLRDERVGRTRILNPGALHRARRYTAMLLDSVADQASVIEIPASARR
ncbi:MAG TPA: YfcE family phosphodiesterase [Phycisphaerales bacterium]|nr:YfcE family phosphodiesterase [Phycisphaerales bacterium]